MFKIDRNTHVLVYGIGKSGTAAVNYLLKYRAKVVITDDKPFYELRYTLEKLLELGAKFQPPSEIGFSITKFDFILVSPGISIKEKPLLKFAKECHIPIINDIELAYNQMSGKWIAITGTNGKTTTTTLIGDILQKYFRRVIVAGNIGTPICQLIDTFTPYNYIVVELSSYQLELIEKFTPKIAIILNISPDHMERYETLEDYANAKKRIFKNQTEEDFLILNYDDPIVRKFILEAKSKVLYFSTQTIVQEGAYIKNHRLYIRVGGKEKEIINTKEIPLIGEHNLSNVMAATLAAYLTEMPVETIKIMIKNFQSLTHRLEKIGTFKGVEIYNDSKATNIDAVIKAIKSFKKPIVLIAGGKDKGGSYEPLIPYLEKQVKFISLFGKDVQRFRNAIKNLPHKVFTNLKDAVIEAWSKCEPGDILLFSPGGSSYDLYSNFEERGEDFKQIIQNLILKHEKTK